MTNKERCIKFETALDIVKNVYSDYCKDESKTREQSREFCYFVIDMAKFLAILHKETNDKEKNKMDIYIFVDDTCIEIFQCEPNKQDEINKYLEELENIGTKYTIKVAQNID